MAIKRLQGQDLRHEAARCRPSAGRAHRRRSREGTDAAMIATTRSFPGDADEPRRPTTTISRQDQQLQDAGRPCAAGRAWQALRMSRPGADDEQARRERRAAHQFDIERQRLRQRRDQQVEDEPDRAGPDERIAGERAQDLIRALARAARRTG